MGEGWKEEGEGETVEGENDAVNNSECEAKGVRYGVAWMSRLLSLH